MVNVSPVEQELKQTSSFKEVLLQSAFSPGRAIADSVRDIDLGIFAEESEGMRHQTLHDLQRREFGKLVVVTNNRMVLLHSKLTSGDEKSVRQVLEINIFNPDILLPWFQRQDRIIGADIHSHPIELPPGSDDLAPILIGDFDKSAQAAIFIVTPARNIVIFRGAGAPQFTRAQINEKIQMWEKLMKERVEQFREPNMPVGEQLILNDKARNALLRSIAQKYHLKIFIGDAESDKITLQT